MSVCLLRYSGLLLLCCHIGGQMRQARACHRTVYHFVKRSRGTPVAEGAFVARSAAKARPGRIFLLLSPAERASIGSYPSALKRSSSVEGDDELTPESSTTPSTESALSRQASSCVEEASFRKGGPPLSDSLPATPFLEVSLPVLTPLPLRQQTEDVGAESAPEERPQMRSVESAPLASGELSNMATCIINDDRIIRKSLSADSDSHASREQLRAALLPPLARAVQALRSAGPAEPPRQSLDSCLRAALRIGSESDLDLSPSMQDLRRLRRAIAAFPDTPAAASAAADGQPSEMQRLSVVMHDLGAMRCASASAVGHHPEDSSVDDLPICLSAPSAIPAECSQGLLPAPMDELSANKTRSEDPATDQLQALLEGHNPRDDTAAAAAIPFDHDVQADNPGRAGERRVEKVRARQVALVLLMLASCLVLPRAAFLCMLASATVFLLCSPSFQEVTASFSSCAGDSLPRLVSTICLSVTHLFGRFLFISGQSCDADVRYFWFLTCAS